MMMNLLKKGFEIGSKFLGGFAEPLGMLMGRQAFGITPHARDSAIAQAISSNGHALSKLAEAQQGLAAVQERRNQLTQIGLVTNTIVAAENLAIAREKLAQDADLARQEREQKVHLSQLWRDLQRELQVKELQHREGLQTRQIQADWDKIKLPTIFSRQELENLAQDLEHPLFVCAKLQITAGCLDYFQTELAADAESQIKKFANSTFQGRVRFYSRFFDDENIFDTNAAQLQSIIPDVPCIMSFSKVTRRCAYFHYKLWGSRSAQLLGGHVDVELPWRELAQQLQATAGEALAADDLYEMIGDWLTTVQKIYAVFLIDLYALVDGDDPFYVTQLEGVNVGLPAGLETEYIRPLALFLRRIQQERITAFNEALRQQQAAAERERQRREAEARRQREAEERRRREEAERRRTLIFKLPKDGGDLEFVWVPAGTLNLNGNVITQRLSFSS